MTFMDVLTSAATGGLTGVIGTGINLIAKYKDKKLQYEHDLKMADKNLDEIKLEAENAVKLEKIRQEGESLESDARNLLTSIKSDKATYSGAAVEGLKVLADKANSSAALWMLTLSYFALTMVDVVRGFTRPFLTGFLVAAVTWIAVKGTSPDLVEQGVSAVVFMGSTALAWWFGTRPHVR